MVIRMRHTRAHTRNRRSHHALQIKNLTPCECGTLVLSHRVCPKCGSYKGRKVVDTTKKLKKKSRKINDKQSTARA